MTDLTMFDTAFNDQFPPNPQAAAGYVDGGIGDQPNYGYIVRTFPKAHHLSIALFAGDDADALDVEAGAASPQDIPGWYARQRARGVSRPCIYASASAMEASVVPIVQVLPGFARSQVRLWSAHYGAGEHICGPSSCGLVSIDMDGTQWISTALGRNLDQSRLAADFFGTPPTPPPHPQEEEMAYVLDSLKHGTAVVLFVPAGKTKVLVGADHGFSGGVQPEIRVGTAPAWNGGPVEKPVWGKPATITLPHGTTEVTIGRQDTGDVPVTVDFA